MISTLALGLVATALLATAECADNNTFAPVLNPDVNVHNISNVVPKTNVTLIYATPDTDASMNVSHIFKYPTIALEEIAAITNVTCSASEVVITFNNATVLTALDTAWSADDSSFVLITNHFGDCDAELERGIFVANTITCDSTTLVCTADVEKSDVRNTASATQIEFGGVPATALSKRTTIDETFTLGGTIALPADTVLYAYKNYVTVTADTASVTAKATFSGYLYFDWWLLALESLYFDVDVDFGTDLALTVNVTSSYSNTFSYTTPSITLPSIEIEGLFSVVPTIDLILGAFISAAETVDLSSNVGISVADGNIHLDLINESKTSSSGWTPTYTTDLSVSGEAAAEFNPFVILDANLAVDFSGVTMAAEAKAEAGFNNTLTLTGSADVSLKGVTSTTSSGTCAEGLELDTQFVFGVNVYLIGTLLETLYPLDITLWDKCFGW